MRPFVTFVIDSAPSQTANQNPGGSKAMTKVTKALPLAPFCHFCHAFGAFLKMKIEFQEPRSNDKSDKSLSAGWSAARSPRPSEIFEVNPRLQLAGSGE
jgi:hypothetical protein